MGTREARTLGLIDEAFGNNGADFTAGVKRGAAKLAASPDFASRLQSKRQCRAADEKHKPLQRYRDEELERMHLNFFGFDPSYHIARYNFVYKVPKSRTPLTIARHRRTATRHS